MPDFLLIALEVLPLVPDFGCHLSINCIILVEEEDGVLSKIVLAIVSIASSCGRGLFHSLFADQSSNGKVSRHGGRIDGRIDELKLGFLGHDGRRELDFQSKAYGRNEKIER